MSGTPTLLRQDFAGQVGKWTVETIALLQSHGGIDAIVAAHNAALTAERETMKRECAKQVADEADKWRAVISKASKLAKETFASERGKVAAAWRKGFDDGFKKGKEGK